MRMTFSGGFRHALAAMLVIAAAPVLAATTAPLASQAAITPVAVPVSKEIPLVAHRAVYDLTLGDTHGQSTIEAITGRIVYDFSGSACAGYVLNFRQVTQISVSSGGSNISDLRSATFEDDKGQNFRFDSQNYLNQKLDMTIDGTADRAGAGDVAVSLTKPAAAKFELPKGVIFPTGQMKAILGAAAAGQSIYESKVYDGSDGGQKVYSTLAVIGKKLDPAKPRDGAAANKKELDGVDRWPVTISYFDPSKPTVGEQTPVYSISFDLYGNGISGDIKLDYGDFTLNGVMTSLDFLPQTKCP